MTANKEKALRAVLTTSTKKQAAKVAGISEKTLHRYFQQQDFQNAYKAALTDMVNDAAQKAKTALAPALAVLGDIASNPEESATSRIAACRGLLEYGMRLIETTDILQRLEALEGER